MIRFSRSIVTPCAAILFLIAGAAQRGAAQDVLHRVEVFAEGGVSTTNQVTQVQPIAITITPPPSLPQVVVLTEHASLRTTGRLFAGVRLWLDANQAIEASYSYSPSDLLVSASAAGLPVGFTSTSPLRASFFAGNYVHTLPRVARLRPFSYRRSRSRLVLFAFRGCHFARPFRSEPWRRIRYVRRASLDGAR